LACSKVVLNKYFVVNLVLSFFFSSRRRHTRSKRDWSSDVCSSDLVSCASAAKSSAIFQLLPMQTKGRFPLSYGRRHEGESCHKRSEERRVGKECRSRRAPYT